MIPSRLIPMLFKRRKGLAFVAVVADGNTPWCLEAAGVWTPGATAAAVYVSGSEKSHVYTAGAEAAQAGC